MSKTEAMSGLSRNAAVMLVAASALIAATPSKATAETAPVVAASFHQSVNTPTDSSAARRRHQLHHSAADAHASYGAAVDSLPSARPSFGYGVNDNSRNMTW
jgi:curli biogenesis system outer membrane secretion channel CsgG